MMVKIWIYPVAILLTTLPCLGMHTGIAGGAAADLPATISGGPDGFGYTWNDHPYQWIDIRGMIHTNEVAGLGDDNVVGFFDISGMSPAFKYFWYDVNQFCVGSNGYISFSDKFLMAHPFQRPPSNRRPNDVLFAFVDDLTFIYDEGDTGHVYYNWEDFGDSCVIQYQDVPFWGNVPGGCEGRNTFEIILIAKPDTQGAIIYQYLTREGTGSGIRYVGWEDMTGQIGWNVTPIPAVGTAIEIENTDPQNPPITDMAVVEAITPGSKGFFAYSGETVEIWAILKNMGNQSVSGGAANCTIEKNGLVVYDENTIFGPFGQGEDKRYYWSLPYYCDDGTGTYTITVTQLVTDYNPANDQVEVEMHVIRLPGWLTYHDGVSETFWAWNGSGSGWGVKFCVPDYVPGEVMIVDEMSVQIGAGTTPFDIWLALISQGLDGLPGDTLADTTIHVTVLNEPTWFSLLVDPGLPFNEGDCYYDGDCFYAAYIHPGESNPYLGMDENHPFSYQGWEYLGSWEPYRHNDKHDPAIRVHATLGGLPDILIRLRPDTIVVSNTLDFTCTFENTTPLTVSGDYWFEVLREGTPVKILGPWYIDLSPGEVKSLHYSFPIPSNARRDIYKFCAFVGSYQDLVNSEDHFIFVIERETPVTLDLLVATPTVHRGETLYYSATFTNNTSEPHYFQYWTKVKLPNGQWYKKYAISPTPLSLGPGERITNLSSHTIPGKAPFGEYEYWGYVGEDTTTVWDDDMFPFTVIEDSLAGRHHPGIDNDEWTVMVERTTTD
jgi:hypothetical protein